MKRLVWLFAFHFLSFIIHRPCSFMEIDINCDMGEWFALQGDGLNASDDELLRIVTSANIACGFHAGDPSVMRRTVDATLMHGVAVGAHPSLPDVIGFGRREIKVSEPEVFDLIAYQIGALEAVARTAGGTVRHVKPHGALYNMAARDAALSDAIARAVKAVNPALVLVGLANSELTHAAEQHGLLVLHEGFCDRTYQADGRLTPRSQPNALHATPADAAAQAVLMATQGVVHSVSGEPVSVNAQTLCIHGDTPNATTVARAVRSALEAAGVVVRARMVMLIIWMTIASSFLLKAQPKFMEQGRLVGIVVCEDDGKPVVGARVFLRNTTIATVTRLDGRFEFFNLLSQQYELVISSLAHTLQRRAVLIKSGVPDTLRVSLQVKAVRFDSLLVAAERPEELKRRIQKAQEILMGTSENAQRCILENPEVLRFSVRNTAFDGQELEIQAVEPLRIRNLALGYVLRYHLVRAGYSTRREWYHGFVEFEEIMPSSLSERQMWQRNRYQAYQGSLPHFLRSQMAGELEKNGFSMRAVSDATDYMMNPTLPTTALMAEDIRWQQDSTGVLQSSSFPAAIAVLFSRAKPERMFVQQYINSVFTRGDERRSLIVPQKQPVLVSSLGCFMQPESIVFYGYYGWQRLADELPMTYYPSEK